MHTSCELGLHPALAAENEPKTLAELAQATDADPTLLRTSPEASDTTAAFFDRDKSSLFACWCKFWSYQRGWPGPLWPFSFLCTPCRSKSGGRASKVICRSLMRFDQAVRLEMLIWSAPSADYVHKTFNATPSLLA